MSKWGHSRLPIASMTSPAHLAPHAPTSPCQPTLLEQATATIARALACGALQPIRTEQAAIVDGGIEFSVRWVSSLALKDRARVDTVIRRQPGFNPFLPPEPALTVAALESSHLVVLNKFPVIDHHLLIVTRAFEAQTAPLTPADFRALATVIGAHGGLGFYNGGRIAGASQPHKHLQWMPADSAASGAGLAAVVRDLPPTAPGELVEHPALPWVHAFVRLDAGAWSEPVMAGDMVRAAFAGACERVALPAAAEPMPPYNLLVSRDWLLLVPRRCEKWQDVSVNSLGYAGSLFVRDREQIDRLRAVGPLAVLSAVGRPR